MVDDGSGDETPDVLGRRAGARELPLAFVRHHRAAGRPPRGTAAGGWPPLPSWPSPTTTACRRPGWLEALLRAAAGPFGRRRPRADAARPGRGGACGPVRQDDRHRGPEPALRDLQHRLLARPPRALGGFDETFPSPAGEDSDLGLPRQRRGRAGDVRPTTPWSTTPCSPARPCGGAPRRPSGHRRPPRIQAEPGAAQSPAPGRVLRPLTSAPPPGRAWRCGSPGATRRRSCSAPPTRRTARACGPGGARPWQAPFYVAFDALQLAATVRGAVRERVLVV